MKRTNFKKIIKNSNTDKKNTIFANPEKYLILKKENYTAEYIRQLKYRLKKRYGNPKE